MNPPISLSTPLDADLLAKQLVESGAQPEPMTEAEAELAAREAKSKREMREIAKTLAPVNAQVPENLRQALLSLPNEPLDRDRTKIVGRQHLGDRVYDRAETGEIRRTDEAAALKAFPGKVRRALRRKLRQKERMERMNQFKIGDPTEKNGRPGTVVERRGVFCIQYSDGNHPLEETL